MELIEYLIMFILIIPCIAIATVIATWLMDKILYFLVKHKIIKLNIFKNKGE